MFFGYYVESKFEISVFDFKRFDMNKKKLIIAGTAAVVIIAAAAVIAKSLTG